MDYEDRKVFLNSLDYQVLLCIQDGIEFSSTPYLKIAK